MPRRRLADAHRGAFGRMNVVVRKPHNLPKALVLPGSELGRLPPLALLPACLQFPESTAVALSMDSDSMPVQEHRLRPNRAGTV
jgi:hypothetical protein